ncbi:IS607 family transposase [Mycobacteroides abscessus]|uniref:IS607 family transposase n=1 Tax=Mycobacteroides abscessus TaxID=36809 RepID=UPI0010CA18CB|nr:IS607 family transposase [Mycobacteroides abscessus]
MSEYAARNGIQYRAAWNRYKAGKIAGAYLDDSGHVVVPEPQHERVGSAAVYARVSTHKQRDDLDRQAQRMVAFANAVGLSVVAVTKEVASGVNDARPKLTALLREDSWGTLVVEHKDRLSRVGFGWFDVLLGLQGRRIVVADAATEEKADLLDDFVSIIYSFAARLYGLRSARRRTDDVIAALDIDPKRAAGLDVQ